MSKQASGIFLVFIFFISLSAKAQEQDSLLSEATLNKCVQYALAHQPTVQQSLINEQIVNADIKTRLADWYPQLNLDYSVQHYFKAPSTVVNGTAITTTAKNYSPALHGLSPTMHFYTRRIFH